MTQLLRTRRRTVLVALALVLSPMLSGAQSSSGLPPLIDRQLFFGNPEVSGATISRSSTSSLPTRDMGSRGQ
jgi:hypothetical protein